MRDDLSDLVAEIISSTTSARKRNRLAELTRYYLRPVGSMQPGASRATLSNWRHEAAEDLAEEMRAPHSAGLTLHLAGVPRKGERLSLTSLARDPALRWILQLDTQERDVAVYRGLADAAAEATAKADAKALVGAALIASRLAPDTHPEPNATTTARPFVAQMVGSSPAHGWRCRWFSFVCIAQRSWPISNYVEPTRGPR